MDAQINKRFWTAVKKGQINAVKSYLGKGHVFTLDSDGNTPLHVSARKGCCELVALFVEKGWSINGQNQTGQTPLMLAIQYGHRDVFNFLLTQNPDLNLRDIRNSTALHKAIWFDDYEMAYQLLEQGASTTIKNTDNYDAWGLAISKDMVDTVEYLFNKINIYGVIDPMVLINASDALINASFRGATKSAKRLIEMGVVDINKQNSDGETALIIAVKQRREDMIKLIIDANADTNIKTNNGFTASDFAKFDNNLKQFFDSCLENHQLNAVITDDFQEVSKMEF